MNSVKYLWKNQKSNFLNKEKCEARPYEDWLFYFITVGIGRL